MGQPKALLERGDGVAFVQHVVNAARVVADEVVLLGRTRDIPNSLSRMTTLPDAKRDAGPLAGLRALMGYAGTRWSLLLACDLPNLRPALLRRLCACAHPPFDAVAYVRHGAPMTYHACCAVYNPGALEIVNHQLCARALRLQSLLAQVRVKGIIPTSQQREQLVNVNTPDDLEHVKYSARSPHLGISSVRYTIG
jgi:molybdopterin-guanine dinucleotide biosynthesis protein A